MRGSREPSDITVETHSNPGEDPLPLLPLNLSKKKCIKQQSTSRGSSEEKSVSKNSGSLMDESAGATACKVTDQINFTSGNPFVEVTKGILHLFKEKLVLDFFFMCLLKL